jgi:hypothetical protein
MNFDPEAVDLADVAERLHESLPTDRIPGYLEGKTTIRDMLVPELGCSELEAEQVVDTLIATGFLRFRPSSSAAESETDGEWQVRVKTAL